jgi:hypothetical protein
MLSDERRATLLLFGAIAYFLAVTAIWVWHDARRRRARKPLFATVLTIFQGPLWLAFYLADRPLCPDERREGGFGWNFARNFAIAWSIANAPLALIMLASALMGTASSSASNDLLIAVLAVAAWCAGPPLLALAIGRSVRQAEVIEQGGSAPQRALLSFSAMYTAATLGFWGILFAAAVLSPLI